MSNGKNSVNEARFSLIVQGDGLDVEKIECELGLKATRMIRKGEELNRLLELGEKYGKTAAQIILRWHLQRGIVVIPKSVHPERMAENFDVFDFTLSAEDMDRVAALDKGQSAFFSHTDPNMVEWFGKMVEERRERQDCARELKNW